MVNHLFDFSDLFFDFRQTCCPKKSENPFFRMIQGPRSILSKATNCSCGLPPRVRKLSWACWLFATQCTWKLFSVATDLFQAFKCSCLRCIWHVTVGCYMADDKKELGAARRSRYYMKYGNPNYGGMKGILSNSWWEFEIVCANMSATEISMAIWIYKIHKLVYEFCNSFSYRLQETEIPHAEDPAWRSEDQKVSHWRQHGTHATLHAQTLRYKIKLT